LSSTPSRATPTSASTASTSWRLRPYDVDPALVEIPARTLDEPRFLVIACLQGRHWSAVITYRQQSIRLISVRRSRPDEVQLYEQL